MPRPVAPPPHACSLLWFRKGLRVHDNPALHAACRAGRTLLPVFVLDPWFLKPDKVGINRLQFLLESLRDLDTSLQARGSKLILLRGKPLEALPAFWRKHGVTTLVFESDTEPYAKERDAAVRALAESDGLAVESPCGHTLYDPAVLLSLCKGKMPISYKGFEKLAAQAGPPPAPLPEAPAQLPPSSPAALAADTGVPAITDMEGYSGEPTTHFKGGESVALARMAEHLVDKAWVAAFEKPKTDPSAFEKPATTVLSPYLKFGCLSARVFYTQLREVLSTQKKHSQPPVSLIGQLLWREFFYQVGNSTVNFDRMEGNPICKQIPWDDNEQFYKAWDEGRTGYPWIDAIMTQLQREGWMHHLARHSVACFLTRGDLYVSWERGRNTFDRLLIDGDWSINNGNWLWLSASAFFSSYFRVYSPVSFGQKYDKEGRYIKKFIPQLKNYPARYIYEPWKASREDQQAWGCVIGKDYPAPIVDHAAQLKVNMDRMKVAYAAGKLGTPPSATPAKRKATAAH